MPSARAAGGAARVETTATQERELPRAYAPGKRGSGDHDVRSRGEQQPVPAAHLGGSRVRATPFRPLVDAPSRDTLIQAAMVASQISKGVGGTMFELFRNGPNLAGAEEITRPYEESVWVYACLHAFSSAAAGVPLALWNGDPDGENGKNVQRLGNGQPLAKLFRRPSKHLAPGQFWEAACLHRKLDGEDIWFLFGADGKPVTNETNPEARIDMPRWILPLRGKAVSIDLDLSGFPQWYRYQSAGGEVKFPAGAVVHFRDYDPSNPLRGLGAVEVLHRDLMVEYQAQRYNEGLLRNGGDPGGFIIRKTAVSHVTLKGEQAEIDETVRNPKNRGRYKVLDGDVSVVQNHVRPKDMEFSELLKSSMHRTSAVTGVPLPIIGVLEQATYSNFQESARQFWVGGLGVLVYLRSVEETLNTFLFPRLKGAEEVVARFDVSDVEALKDDKSEQFKLASEIANQGVGVSFNEALVMLGVEVEMPKQGDVQLVPSGKTTLDRVLSGENVPKPVVPGEEDEDEDEDEEPEDVDAGDDDEVEEEDAKAAAAALTRSIYDAAEGGADVDADVVDRDEGFEDRRAYWGLLERNLLSPRETELRKKLSGYLRSYGTAQIKRLEDYAESGEEARGVRDARLRIVAEAEAELARQQALPEAERTHIPLLRAPNDQLTVASLTEADFDVLLLDYSAWVAKLRSATNEPLRRTMREALEGMAAELEVLALPMDDPRILSALETQLIQLTEGVNSTLAKRVRRALYNEVKDNLTSPAKLQEVVRELLPELKGKLKQVFANRDARASTIARTETARASNTGRHEEMKAEGVAKHKWITSGDVAVRGTPGGPYADAHYSHYDLDGEVRNIGDEFIPSLRHPNDPEGPAGAVINCRCVAAPVIED